MAELTYIWVCNRIKNTITSCETKEQLRIARRYCMMLLTKYSICVSTRQSLVTYAHNIDYKQYMIIKNNETYNSN